MKRIVLSFILAASFFGTTAITSCSNETKKEPAANEANKDVYECPMKCEGKTFSEPGKCPVCGMNLEKVEHKEDGHAH